MPKESQNINNMSMLDLFKQEISSQSDVISNQVKMLATENDSVEITHTLLRAFHSMKGAAHIVDIKQVVNLASVVEKFLSNLHIDNTNNTFLSNYFNKIVNFLNRLTQQSNDQILNWIKQHQTDVDSLLSALSKLDATAHDQRDDLSIPEEHDDKNSSAKLQSPLNFGDLSLFGIFKEETSNHCSLLSNNILNLEKSPNDLSIIESSMRSTHSIKGAARVIELMQIVELSHSMEEVFLAAQKRSILLSNEHFDLLLSSIDFLEELVAVDETNLQNWYEENFQSSELIIAKLNEISTCSNEVEENLINVDQKSGFDQQNSFVRSQLAEESPIITEADPISHDPDRMIKISTSGLNRIMGFTSEMISEAKWLPKILNKCSAIKRNQEILIGQMDEIRRKFHESHFDPKIESSFVELSKHDRYCRKNMAEFLSEIEDHAGNSNEISHKLQKEMVLNSMQPFSDGITTLPRLVRDFSKNHNKNISLEISGKDTMVDRDILEKIESPLNHLITNALDHGIEDGEERRSFDKPNNATIRIDATHKFGTLVITVSDDGRGIDVAKLRQTIVSKNLVSKTIASKLSEQEIMEFLFLPNFSTKEITNHISGRGVGLDVVHNTIKQIRGTVNVSSIIGKGTMFELQLPISLSISRCLLSLINNEIYAFPLVQLEHVTKISEKDILEVEGRQYFKYKNKRVGLVSAQQALDLSVSKQLLNNIEVIILNSDSLSYGLIVDELLGVSNLMVQPLNPRLGKLRSISATAIDEHGTPILIMDILDIIQSMDHLISTDRLHKIDSSGNIEDINYIKNILVVDDSKTVREVEFKLLKRQGYDVVKAVDGIDGWNKVKQIKFDLLITDIDMPHMDGIDLVKQIKEDDSLESLPIIIVSYKDSVEDRNRGLEVGADYYLTKASFLDQTLLDAVFDLIGGPTEYNEKISTGNSVH